ncbi:uncharacterized protein BJX67DRAFT_92361 [Aspergillus lucknowensis]|uniref:Uncharacterized protein n=1 Tax=Aspergillus lucknowensis TaxID=176173 RepID=A0ABR4M5P7_9EURO
MRVLLRGDRPKWKIYQSGRGTCMGLDCIGGRLPLIARGKTLPGKTGSKTRGPQDVLFSEECFSNLEDTHRTIPPFVWRQRRCQSPFWSTLSYAVTRRTMGDCNVGPTMNHVPTSFPSSFSLAEPLLERRINSCPIRQRNAQPFALRQRIHIKPNAAASSLVVANHLPESWRRILSHLLALASLKRTRLLRAEQRMEIQWIFLGAAVTSISQ